jgi:hypothetical protein
MGDPGMSDNRTSKTVTKQVEEGMRLRHAEVEGASDKLSTAGAMAYLSHLDRGELLAEVERLRNALSQSIETVKRLMAESRPVETSAPRALAKGDEVTYTPLYDSKLPREGWKVEVLPKLTYVIKHPNGSLIAVDAAEITAVEPSGLDKAVARARVILEMRYVAPEIRVKQALAVLSPSEDDAKYILEAIERAEKAAADLPACECLVRDKAPSAYHNVKCPRYVADLL